ncbi:hypothetical protein BOX15_Mlig002594g1, partial [Macrostomum lignano]
MPEDLSQLRYRSEIYTHTQLHCCWETPGDHRAFLIKFSNQKWTTQLGWVEEVRRELLQLQLLCRARLQHFVLRRDMNTKSNGTFLMLFL